MVRGLPRGQGHDAVDGELRGDRADGRVDVHAAAGRAQASVEQAHAPGTGDPQQRVQGQEQVDDAAHRGQGGSHRRWAVADHRDLRTWFGRGPQHQVLAERLGGKPDGFGGHGEDAVIGAEIDRDDLIDRVVAQQIGHGAEQVLRAAVGGVGQRVGHDRRAPFVKRRGWQGCAGSSALLMGGVDLPAFGVALAR
nr:hypothetical protein [Actinoplanes ferrugineus]